MFRTDLDFRTPLGSRSAGQLLGELAVFIEDSIVLTDAERFFSQSSAEIPGTDRRAAYFAGHRPSKNRARTDEQPILQVCVRRKIEHGRTNTLSRRSSSVEKSRTDGRTALFYKLRPSKN